MKIDIKPGKYVVAVSGGVDSVVLLDLLAKQEGVKLTVAHFDHGIREDSAKDRLFVAELAAKYKLPFVFNMGNLGADASEDTARKARYDFLGMVQKSIEATAIITAHHQDDMVETAIINLLRGTGRKGLTALQSSEEIIRPLLSFTKQELIAYAKEHKLQWQEDPTNQDTKYLRNYVRLVLLPKFSEADRKAFLAILKTTAQKNIAIDEALLSQLHVQPAADQLDRHWFTMLDHSVAKEAMASWLRHNKIANFDSKTIERLVVAAKTLAHGKKVDIDKIHELLLGKEYLKIVPREGK